MALQSIQYEERFGVKVDIRLASEDKKFLYDQWQRWFDGSDSDYISLDKANLMTAFEHLLIGSGVGIPPDPFKPLAAQHQGANLEEIIRARRIQLPSNVRYQHMMYINYVKDFQELTGLDSRHHILEVVRPDISRLGRVPAPKVIGVYGIYDTIKQVNLSQNIINSLKFIDTRKIKLISEDSIQRVFDYDNGFRIELVTNDD